MKTEIIFLYLPALKKNVISDEEVHEARNLIWCTEYIEDKLYLINNSDSGQLCYLLYNSHLGRITSSEFSAVP